MTTRDDFDELELEELLSAYLDGETSPDETRAVDVLVDTDPHTRELLSELRTTRRLVRDLPEVEPRRPIDELVPASTGASASTRWGTRRVAGLATAVLGVAAIWLAILTFGTTDVVPGFPDVEALSLRHAEAMEVDESDFAPMTVDEIEMDKLAPPSLMGMAREGIYQRNDIVQVVFFDGEHVVSVFHQPGEVDWKSMPGGGEMMDMEDGPAWHTVMDDKEVLVTELSGQMVTIVADGDMSFDMVQSIPSMLS